MTKNPQITTVEFSPETRNDRADICRYTFDKFGENQVDVFLSKPAEGIQYIRVMPRIGHRHDEIPGDLFLAKMEQNYLV